VVRYSSKIPLNFCAGAQSEEKFLEVVADEANIILGKIFCGRREEAVVAIMVVSNI